VAAAAFVAGGALAIGALATLGRCFAILPSVRGVVSSGPFAWIRHPAYLGELVMVTACGMARSLEAGAVLGVAALGLVAVRIGVEEQMLGRLPSYRAYREAVRWRLIPGLW
jgi:protein-S-isoprenylcysteine O-methyltransferase Ste14